MSPAPRPRALVEWSAAIDHLLALDVGGRGIGTFFQPGAAAAAARTLGRASRVLLTTGFTVGPGMPETDGPPGTAVLGRALRTLGAAVCYVTDAVAAPLLRAELAIVGEPENVVVYPDGPDAARNVLADVHPSHLIAVERPGRTRDGDYLSARGESVRAWNAPLDELFLAAWSGRAGGKASLRSADSGGRVVTVGVGDGGNEIGMGNVRARLARRRPELARMASVIRVDHLVVAGTSNWGAYGIVAALEALTGQSLLHTPEIERRLIEACVRAGGVDGMTRRPAPTVDGLGLDIHGSVVTLLRLAARQSPRGHAARRSPVKWPA